MLLVKWDNQHLMKPINSQLIREQSPSIDSENFLYQNHCRYLLKFSIKYTNNYSKLSIHIKITYIKPNYIKRFRVKTILFRYLQMFLIRNRLLRSIIMINHGRREQPLYFKNEDTCILSVRFFEKYNNFLSFVIN